MEINLPQAKSQEEVGIKKYKSPGNLKAVYRQT